MSVIYIPILYNSSIFSYRFSSTNCIFFVVRKTDSLLIRMLCCVGLSRLVFASLSVVQFNLKDQRTRVAKPLFALSPRRCFHFEIEVANVIIFAIEDFPGLAAGTLINWKLRIESRMNICHVYLASKLTKASRVVQTQITVQPFRATLE